MADCRMEILPGLGPSFGFGLPGGRTASAFLQASPLSTAVGSLVGPPPASQVHDIKLIFVLGIINPCRPILGLYKGLSGCLIMPVMPDIFLLLVVSLLIDSSLLSPPVHSGFMQSRMPSAPEHWSKGLLQTKSQTKNQPQPFSAT